MKHFIVLFVILSSVFAYAESGFTPDGQIILEEDFNQLQFPQDLEKTNLRITPMSDQNPFEWAGRIQSRSDFGIFPCTGGVVALPGYRPQDKALVLTAGHCVNIRGSAHLEPKRVLLNEPLNSEIYFDFPRPRKSKNAEGQWVEGMQYYFKRIVFASFDVVDLALLEMNETYEQLQYNTQKPPMLVRRAFKMNEDITAFGIPASDTYESHLFHMATCKTSGLMTSQTGYGNVENPEDLYNLTRRVLINCTFFGGMSGGYVRDGKGQVIGVNSGVMRNDLSFYAGTAPLMHCATKEGRFNEDCLASLKSKIEIWKGRTKN